MPGDLTPADLAALEALEKQATTGPWRDWLIVPTEPEFGAKVVGNGYSIMVADTRIGSVQDSADCALVVMMRNALPSLLALAREAKNYKDVARMEAQEVDERGAKIDKLREEREQLRLQLDAIAGEVQEWGEDLESPKQPSEGWSPALDQVRAVLEERDKLRAENERLRKERDKTNLKAVIDAANEAIAGARPDDPRFKTEPINWGDLGCVEARLCLDEVGRESIEVEIEEASPECRDLRRFIKEALAAKGFDVIVMCDW